MEITLSNPIPAEGFANGRKFMGPAPIGTYHVVRVNPATREVCITPGKDLGYTGTYYWIRFDLPKGM